MASGSSHFDSSLFASPSRLSTDIQLNGVHWKTFRLGNPHCRISQLVIRQWRITSDGPVVRGNFEPFEPRELYEEPYVEPYLEPCEEPYESPIQNPMQNPMKSSLLAHR